MEISHQKFPCGIAAEYCGLFSSDHAATICREELAVVTVFVSLSSSSNTIVLFCFGGLLHVPTVLSKLGFCVSALGPAVVLVDADEHFVNGGNANTIQFPHKSLNGFGIFVHMLYGQKHIAIPSPSVSVGAIYNLNCDHCHQKIHPAPAGVGGQIGITEFVGNDITGNHLPSV